MGKLGKGGDGEAKQSAGREISGEMPECPALRKELHSSSTVEPPYTKQDSAAPEGHESLVH